MRILNFGSLNIDYVYTVPHFVQPGETLHVLQQQVYPGGKGLNQSVALARAGASVFHAGCVADAGEWLVQLLRENGADVSHIRRVQAIQGNAVIEVNAEGENRILVFGGTNACVTAEQITQTLSDFAAGDLLLVQNEINRIPQLIDAAYAHGMRIVFNPSPCDDTIRNVDLDKVSWLLVNETEARQISAEAQPQAAWKTLHEQYPLLSVLLTLGSAGSIAFQPSGETIRRPAFPVQAADSTAAGDTFTGYFLAGLQEQLPLKDCIRRASAAAAISVTRPGAASSIPYRAEVDAFLARQPEAE